jgi:hypothetical protein
MIVDHQRRFFGVLLSAEPSEDDLAKLGGQPERWLLYRDMIRKRMRNMIKSGLPRTVEALGADRYLTSYDAWLAEAAPRARYIREIIQEFAEFAIPRWAADDSGPKWLPELARFESTWWHVGYENVVWPSSVGEFAFEKRAVMNPTLRLMRFGHRVHEKLSEGETEYPAKNCAVVVYRRPDNDRIFSWVPNALSADLIEGWLKGDEIVADVVKRVCEARDVTIDQKFIESLGTMLADFIERSIVLGGT